ncbi:MAG: Hsp70 family protein [Planctomycetota bacterium]
MNIIIEPVFFELLRVESGIKKGLIHILNQSDEDFKAKVVDVKKPAWIEFEKIEIGGALSIKKRGKAPFVVRVDTGHKLFADEIDDNNGITLETDQGDPLQIAIVVEKVIKEIPRYNGTFAIDFGTTNSCYAFRSRVGEASDIEGAFKKAKTSDVIPSVIFFTDVDKTDPKFHIGNAALFDIEENSSQTYAYFRSIKRFLGSDRTFTVLDKYSGLKPERRQRWKAEDIASFYIAALIREAEIVIGARVNRVIATYPVLFARTQKKALHEAFKKAYAYLGRQIKDGDIILNVDESTAAGFNYIYGPLLDEFRIYESMQSANRLLTFDFGGGTIDVSLMDIDINRTEGRKVKVAIAIEGITGSRHYGGDNVTLEVFKILKNRLALTVAAALVKDEAEKPQAAAEVAPEKPADIFAAGSAKDDFWSVDAAEAKAPAEAGQETVDVVPAEEVESELSEIVNNTDTETFMAALKLVRCHSPAIEKSVSANLPLATVLLEDGGAGNAGFTATMARNEAEEIDKAIELVCPTRFDAYKDKDPIKGKVARILFNEIWNEADRMKVRASVSPDGLGELGMEMKKVALYAGVEDFSIFNRSIKITIGEIETRIRGDITKYVTKAFRLHKSTHTKAYGSLMVEDAAADATEKLTVILSGNSSRLALVKRIFLDVFSLQEGQIKIDQESIKKDVA